MMGKVGGEIEAKGGKWEQERGDKGDEKQMKIKCPRRITMVGGKVGSSEEKGMLPHSVSVVHPPLFIEPRA